MLVHTPTRARLHAHAYTHTPTHTHTHVDVIGPYIHEERAEKKQRNMKARTKREFTTATARPSAPLPHRLHERGSKGEEGPADTKERDEYELTTAWHACRHLDFATCVERDLGCAQEVCVCALRPSSPPHHRQQPPFFLPLHRCRCFAPQRRHHLLCRRVRVSVHASLFFSYSSSSMAVPSSGPSGRESSVQSARLSRSSCMISADSLCCSSSSTSGSPRASSKA